MTELQIDIETIPAQASWVREEIAETIKPPGNIKKEESIAAWTKDKAHAVIDKKLAETSFNGGVGELICIGYAFDDDDVQLAGRKLGESEGDMIQSFADATAADMEKGRTKNEQYTWIGHHITGFDLHFFWQRCIVNNIKMPIEVPHTAKPWHSDVFDTCHEWKMGTSGFGSLSSVCRILGIERDPNDIPGSEVWAAIQRGEYDKVFKHCRLDVKDCRKVYNRIRCVR